jgi:hypothetical protein
MTPTAVFLAHRAACPVCQSRPFNVCAEAARLLAAALAAEPPITRYNCKQHCVTTGQSAPEKCKHGAKAI